jgi:rubrerythrin
MVQRLTVIEADADYVEFWPAGSRAKGEFRCADCGYGAIVTAALPRCPMCGCASWEATTWSPFRRASTVGGVHARL